MAAFTGGILVGLFATAAAASGSVDNIVPTGTYDEECAAVPASDPWDATLCRTDNEDLSYYMTESGNDKLESADEDAVYEAMTEEYTPTDLVVSYDSTPDFSGASETDIIFEEGPMPNPPISGIYGVTWCDDPVNGTTYKCDQAYVRIIGNGAYNKFLVCHEAGHAVGLTHGQEAYPSQAQTASVLGCLRTDIDPGTANGDLGSNQVANINAVY